MHLRERGALPINIHCVRQAGAGVVWEKNIITWLVAGAGAMWERKTVALEGWRPAEHSECMPLWHRKHPNGARQLRLTLQRDGASSFLPKGAYSQFALSLLLKKMNSLTVNQSSGMVTHTRQKEIIGRFAKKREIIGQPVSPFQSSPGGFSTGMWQGWLVAVLRTYTQHVL